MKPLAAGEPSTLPRIAVEVDAWVHVRVGRCHIAIPVGQVLEAIPIPPEGLTPLPRRSGALLGVVQAAGVPVPVVALERWLPIDAAAAPEGQPRLVLVLHDAGRQIALQVDAVLGVKPAPAGTFRQVHHAEDAHDELFESVIAAADDRPALCRLEVGRLMRLSRVWCAEAETEHFAPTSSGNAASTPAEPQGAAPIRHAVFQIGDERWAVPVSALERVVPVPAVELALAGGRRNWAIAEWQARKLPLVDISAARAASSRASAPWMALLSQGPLALGLTVAACLQFVDLAADACAAMPEDELLTGMAVHADLGKLRVLDPDKLFRLTPETSISRDAPAAAPHAAGAAGAASDAAEPVPYLVFEADQRYATPVEGIVGVVELPDATRADLCTGGPAVLAWRGQTLRVVALPTLSDARRHGARADARLAILVQPADAAASPLGIAVKRLADWLPAHSAWRSGMRMGSLGAFSLIDAPGSQDMTSLVVVDLAQMAYLLD